jgi:hypothetical protein
MNKGESHDGSWIYMTGRTRSSASRGVRRAACPPRGSFCALARHGARPKRVLGGFAPPNLPTAYIPYMRCWEYGVDSDVARSCLYLILVSQAFIRDRQTQPGSPIPGSAVGAFTAYLVSERASTMHGHAIRLHSLQQLQDVGLELSPEGAV